MSNFKDKLEEEKIKNEFQQLYLTNSTILLILCLSNIITLEKFKQWILNIFIFIYILLLTSIHIKFT